MLRLYNATIRERLLLRRVERAVYAVLGQRDFFTVEAEMVSEAEIRALNKSTRDIDRVTDVLSYPSFEGLTPPVSEDDFEAYDTEGGRVFLGSIAICRRRAEEQAAEYGHSVRRETGFLLAHGMLHLLGYDHIMPHDEEVMTALQKKIMDEVRLAR